MFFFFEGFQSQKVLILFLFAIKHFDFFIAKITPNMAEITILVTITPGVNMTTGQMTPFLFICLLNSICWYISSSHFKTFITQFWGLSLHYVLVSKMHFYMPKMTLSRLLTYISYFYVTFANSSYITCFVLRLIPIWARSHGLYCKSRELYLT